MTAMDIAATSAIDPTDVVVEDLISPSRGAPLRTKVAIGMRWGLFDQVIQFVVRLVATVIMSRVLGPRQVGIFQVAMVVVNFASLLSGVGLGPALIQREKIDRRHVGVALVGSTALGVIIGGLLALTAGPMASFFHEPSLKPVLVAVSITFVFMGVEGVPNAMLKRALRFREFVLS